MQMILRLRTSSMLCFDNSLYFSFAEEALISAHHLMLNTSSEKT